MSEGPVERSPGLRRFLHPIPVRAAGTQPAARKGSEPEHLVQVLLELLYRGVLRFLVGHVVVADYLVDDGHDLLGFVRCFFHAIPFRESPPLPRWHTPATPLPAGGSLTMPTDVIHSREYRALRTAMKAIWQPVNAPCGICGQATIDWDAPKNDPDAFELDHRISRKRAKAMGRLDLLLDPNNAQPSHCRCNRSKQEGDGPVALGETSEEF